MLNRKKQTECVQPSGYETSKNGRLMFFCTCAECGIKKYKFVKNTEGGTLGFDMARWLARQESQWKTGRGFDIQKQLAKLGQLHMRTSTGKKYNYCGPGTKLEERLASNDPRYRDPINNLDSICQKHDTDYSNATSLADKHKADELMLKRISDIPYWKRPWETSIAQAAIKSKNMFGLGTEPKNGKRC